MKIQVYSNRKIKADYSKMCLNCLNIILRDNDEYIQKIEEYLSGTDCPCCISFPTFLKNVCYDLKIYILIKKKMCETGVNIRSLETLAERKKNEISTALNNSVELLFESKEELDDGDYLSRMNQIHKLNSLMTRIDEAHHR